MAFATIADLEARYGTLSSEQATRANALLDDACGMISAFCTEGLERLVDDERILRPVGTQLRLPEPPVVSVTSVTAIARDGGADVELDGWSFDGIDQVGLRDAVVAPWVDQVTWWSKIQLHTNTYRVIYTHGPDSVPATARSKACQMVNRVLSSPSKTEGVVDRRIGQFGEQYVQRSGSTGLAVILTEMDRRDLVLAGLRRQSDSSQVQGP